MQTSYVIFTARIKNYYIERLVAFTNEVDLANDNAMYDFVQTFDIT